MKSKIILSFVLCAVFVPTVLAGDYHCFPKSDLTIPTVKFKNNKSLTGGTAIQRGQSNLSQIIQHFKNFWNPILDQKYHKAVSFIVNWDTSEVDASTTRDDDNNPVIVITGGLARHPELSDNGLLLILCHELGHHYGGAPKYFRGRSTRRSWSSAEGQADYFATNKCFKKMMAENAIFLIAKQLKTQYCTDQKCDPVAMAALSVGNVFASLKPYWQRPSINGHSDRQVDITFYKHSDPQCRFDTYIAGNRCSLGLEFDFDDHDHRIGSCVRTDNPNAARPICWFSPLKY